MAVPDGLRAAGKYPGGILPEVFWKDGARAGFDVVDLGGGARTPLCRRGPAGRGVSTGRFNFYDEGLAAGLKALSPESLAGADVVFVDEAGWLELEGKGWAPAFPGLRAIKVPLVVVVRDYLVDKVSAALALGIPTVWEAGKADAAAPLAELSAAVDASRR
jgi:nucleoside-triphosphatase THEP1